MCTFGVQITYVHFTFDSAMQTSLPTYDIEDLSLSPYSEQWPSFSSQSQSNYYHPSTGFCTWGLPLTGFLQQRHDWTTHLLSRTTHFQQCGKNTLFPNTGLHLSMTWSPSKLQSLTKFPLIFLCFFPQPWLTLLLPSCNSLAMHRSAIYSWVIPTLGCLLQFALSFYNPVPTLPV